MPSDQDLYNELAFYTLAHGDPAFIHQNVVDAFAAQTTGPSTKPITIVFALIGLYLHVEKGFTGKQVQRAHMQLAKYRRQWFMPALPLDRGAIRIQDVLAAAPGPKRDGLIRKWCESAWPPWSASRQQIVDLAKSELGVD
jgi:hypothetical protein